jgi:hypothetical protein
LEFTHPGAIPLTRTSGASPRASSRVNPTRPALAVAYAVLLAPPRHRLVEANVQALLYTLGAILAFLLLNIEIADYFSSPGANLTFNFSGNLAQDMTYSLAWGIFAFALLSGMSDLDAARVANTAAGIVVGKLGTATVTLAELRERLHARPEHSVWRFAALGTTPRSIRPRRPRLLGRRPPASRR